MKNNYYEDLEHMLKNLLESGNGDVEIILNGNKIKKVHKVVLEYNSEVLSRMLNNGMKESSLQKIDMSNYSEKSVNIFFEFCYCKKLDITKISIEELMDFLEMLNYYDIKNHQNIISENFDFIVKEYELKDIIKMYSDNQANVSNLLYDRIVDFLSKKYKFAIIDQIEYKNKLKNILEQFDDDCYDLLKPGEAGRPFEYKYTLCCKHRNMESTLEIPKTILSTREGKKCCIGISVTQFELIMNAKDYQTDYCCSHRKKKIDATSSFIATTKRPQFEKECKEKEELKKEFDDLSKELKFDILNKILYN